MNRMHYNPWNKYLGVKAWALFSKTRRRGFTKLIVRSSDLRMPFHIRMVPQGHEHSVALNMMEHGIQVDHFDEHMRDWIAHGK